MRVLVLQGPNLNLLGEREPSIYGRQTLDEIHAGIADRAAELGIQVDFFQSNHEGALIDRLHRRDFDAAIVNAAGLTHTSVALRDALLAVERPFVEVHLSDPATREPFRHVNFLADIALQSFVGMGAAGYRLALESLAGQDVRPRPSDGDGGAIARDGAPDGRTPHRHAGRRRRGGFARCPAGPEPVPADRRIRARGGVGRASAAPEAYRRPRPPDRRAAQRACAPGHAGRRREGGRWEAGRAGCRARARRPPARRDGEPRSSSPGGSPRPVQARDRGNPRPRGGCQARAAPDCTRHAPARSARRRTSHEGTRHRAPAA
jgi:3-dehydroquinate dehydratase-2